MSLPADYHVLNCYRQVCTCGATYTHSNLYVRTEQGLRPTHSRPAFRPHVINVPVEHIALCPACYAKLDERPEGEPYPLHARAAWRNPVASASAANVKKEKFDLSILDTLAKKDH